MKISATFILYVLTKYWRVERYSAGHILQCTDEPLGQWVYFWIALDRTCLTEQFLFSLLLKMWKTKKRCYKTIVEKLKTSNKKIERHFRTFLRFGVDKERQRNSQHVFAVILSLIMTKFSFLFWTMFKNACGQDDLLKRTVNRPFFFFKL